MRRLFARAVGTLVLGFAGVVSPTWAQTQPQYRGAPLGSPLPAISEQLSLPTDTPEIVEFEKTLKPKGSTVSPDDMKALVSGYCALYMKPARDALAKQVRTADADPVLLREVLTENRTCEVLKGREYRTHYKVVYAGASPQPASGPSASTPAPAKFATQQVLGEIHALNEQIVWRKSKDRCYSANLLFHPSHQYVLALGCKSEAFDGEGNVFKALSLSGEGGRIWASAFNRDGTLIAWERNGRLYVAKWDLKSGPTSIRECSGHTRMITRIVFAANEENSLYSTSDDGTTRIWLLSNASCTERNRLRFGGSGVALTASGTAYRIEKGMLLITQMATDHGSTTKSDLDHPASLIWNETASRLFGGGFGQASRYDVAPLFEIDKASGAVSFFTESVGSDRVGSAFKDSTLFSSSHDGRFVAYVSGYSARRVYIFDTLKKAPALSFEASPRAVLAFSFVPDSYSFVIATEDEIYLWRLEGR